MPDHNGLLSFIANRRVGTKIGAGFAVVLAILAISSTIVWLAFGRVTTAVDRYADLVSRSSIYRDVDRTVAQYRGHVREYVYSHDDATAEAAVADARTLRGIVTTGLTRVANPERQAGGFLRGKLCEAAHHPAGGCQAGNRGAGRCRQPDD
jgi:hypothetical protein